MCHTVFPMPALVLTTASLMVSMAIGRAREFHSPPWCSEVDKGQQKGVERNGSRVAVPSPRRKVKCNGAQRKTKIDSRDDDDLYSHVWCMGLATMSVETGDFEELEMLEVSQKSFEIYSWEARRSEAKEASARECTSVLGTAKAAASSSV